MIRSMLNVKIFLKSLIDEFNIFPNLGKDWFVGDTCIKTDYRKESESLEVSIDSIIINPIESIDIEITL